jgi:hypothetical protein
MIAKLLFQNTITTVAMGALLFVCAGTMHWPSAWVFLASLRRAPRAKAFLLLRSTDVAAAEPR